MKHLTYEEITTKREENKTIDMYDDLRLWDVLFAHYPRVISVAATNIFAAIERAGEIRRDELTYNQSASTPFTDKGRLLSVTRGEKC